MGHLTVAAVEKAKATGENRRELSDDDPRGLYLHIYPNTQRKVWVVNTRLNGRQIKYKIGAFPEFDLKAARAEAKEILRIVARGDDPRKLRAEKQAEAERQEQDSVEKVIERWLRRDQKGKRSEYQVRQIMAKDVTPHWGKRSIHEITKRDVIELLDGIVDRGHAPHANHVHARLRRFFNWCVEVDILNASPMRNVGRPGGKAVERDRVLGDEELARVWHAAGRLRYPFGPAVRLLILTGARRSEITALRWREIQGDQIKLAGSRTKTGEPHTIPISPQAQAILDELPRISAPKAKKPEYVFTTTAKTPVSGFSKWKERLDREVAKIGPDGEDLNEPDPLPEWRLHDLRRTCATGLQRLGFRLEVIEAVIGHKSGTGSGIVKVYQRHSFDPEKRQALEAWGRHVAGLIEPKAGAEIHSIAEARG